MRAVLDACVLLPTILREILVGAAANGAFEPIWSARILEEWRRASTRLSDTAPSIAGAEIALLRDAWQAAEVSPEVTLRDLPWPDPADAHLAETALSAQAAVIVTANLKDFPARLLGPLSLRAIHPDPFLLERMGAAPDAVEQAVAATLSRAREMGSDLSERKMLKLARLPRLARALNV